MDVIEETVVNSSWKSKRFISFVSRVKIIFFEFEEIILKPSDWKENFEC